jgi:large subunit ribosomal protein L14e
MVFELGRVCVKLMGRDAGQTCVVVDVFDNKFVLIDGNTRRRKCNIMHLMPTEDVLDIKKKATTEDVKAALAKTGVKVKPETKPKRIAKKPLAVRLADKKKENVSKK